MNTTLSEGIKLVSEIKDLLTQSPANDVVIIVAPPYTHLQKIVELTDDSNICVAAQNCSHEPKGAYTGEISAEMIRSAGAEYVIIGHSERRAYFKEDNAILSKKIDLALANDLLPIYCCGETSAERNANNHFETVRNQIEKGLFHLSANDFGKIIVAYEPVWAIGTGVTATPEQAQEMHVHIRSIIEVQYGNNTAENTSIIYGGSCNPANAGELFANPDVDGGLIGGASLKAGDFISIIKEMQNAKIKK
ncbi:MAG TPA: triose-phosphate isomerase [bacterium]|nr:triose-phosphate isomerase [bacterium]